MFLALVMVCGLDQKSPFITEGCAYHGRQNIVPHATEELCMEDLFLIYEHAQTQVAMIENNENITLHPQCLVLETNKVEDKGKTF